MTQMIQNFVRDEEGAALVEYGMLVALIAMICIIAVQAFGNNVLGIFNGINDDLEGSGLPGGAAPAAGS